jgi:predicted nuclease of predicted toxin-antitoxin system
LRFLADESCDFAVIRALREAGHDVTAVAEINPGVDDRIVIALAHSESRVLLTEDKDFGQLVYAGGQKATGVILIRFPSTSRSTLGQAIASVVGELADRLAGAFVVLEPGRARLSPTTPEP